MRKSGHRFLPICGARSSALWFAPRSRLSPTTTSDCIPTLYLTALTTHSAQIRSFQCSETDRPSRTICSKLPADFQMLRSLPTNLPCDLHSNMPTGFAPKPVCRGRPYWTLACSLSTCSGWDGCSSRQQSSIFSSSFALPPAGFLQTNTRVHHTVTQDSPSRGAVTGHSQTTVHTSRRRQQNTGVQELLQNNPGGNNI